MPTALASNSLRMASTTGESLSPTVITQPHHRGPRDLDARIAPQDGAFPRQLPNRLDFVPFSDYSQRMVFWNDAPVKGYQL